MGAPEISAGDKTANSDNFSVIDFYLKTTSFQKL